MLLLTNAIISRHDTSTFILKKIPVAYFASYHGHNNITFIGTGISD